MLIPSALFAREVSSAFLWDAAVDTTGRVITGSTDETSDYWYVFDDGVYGGTSTWIWPSDIEEDIRGDMSDLVSKVYFFMHESAKKDLPRLMVKIIFCYRIVIFCWGYG